MKRTLLATSVGLSIAALLGLVHCSQPASTYMPPGGASGSTGTGGSAPQAGAAPAVAGSTTTGTAGSVAAAGSSGAPSVAGCAGTDAAGGAVGVGGATGTAGGSGGAVGTGGAPGLSVSDVFGIKNSFGDQLADSFILFPCYAKAGQDCITIPSGASCPNQDNTALPYEERGAQFHEDFHIGGTPGAMYIATIHVDGITEAKYYEKGTCTGSDTPATPWSRGAALLFELIPRQYRLRTSSTPRTTSPILTRSRWWAAANVRVHQGRRRVGVHQRQAGSGFRRRSRATGQ